MADFNVKCPYCNAETIAEMDWIGKNMECPVCMRTFVVTKEEHKFPKLSMPQIELSTQVESSDEGLAEKSISLEVKKNIVMPLIGFSLFLALSYNAMAITFARSSVQFSDSIYKTTVVLISCIRLIFDVATLIFGIKSKFTAGICVSSALFMSAIISLIAYALW